MKNKLLIVLIIFAFGKASAQVPGYIGKKIGVKYHFNTGLTNLFEFSDWRVKKKHTFGVDFTVGRRLAFSAAYGFSNLDIDIYSGSRFSHYYQEAGQYVESSYSGKDYQFKLSYFEFTTKIFIMQSIAPIGNYISLGFSSTRWKSDDRINIYSVDPSGYSDSYTDNKTYSGMGLVAGFGRSGILFGPVFIDAAMDICVPVTYDERSKYITSERANGMVKDNSWYHFKVGIGVLI